MQLNELQNKALQNAQDKGFVVPGVPCDIIQQLFLIAGEAHEAGNALNEDKFEVNMDSFSEHLQLGYDFNECFEREIKNRFPDELADVVIRCFTLAGWLGIDLEEFIKLKLKYNATRPYKHGKNF